jgi:hypothetical protein
MSLTISVTMQRVKVIGIWSWGPRDDSCGGRAPPPEDTAPVLSLNDSATPPFFHGDFPYLSKKKDPWDEKNKLAGAATRSRLVDLATGQLGNDTLCPLPFDLLILCGDWATGRLGNGMGKPGERKQRGGGNRTTIERSAIERPSVQRDEAVLDDQADEAGGVVGL